jgi:aryl-phospho-beta-D-glucosidase BglC (GH1 family)
MTQQTSLGDGPPLKRGVNLAGWFVHRGSYEPQHLKTYLTADDFRLIKTLGFDHVRMPIDQGPLWNSSDASILNPAYLPLVDEAIDKILAAGLDVVVDLHASDAFNVSLRSEGEGLEKAVKFWTSLAKHLSGRDPQHVALEALNEPTVEDPGSWQRIAGRLTAAIRAGAPKHTIIIGGGRWSSADDLAALRPVGDRNVVYTFHMYEPFTFTHQGATWGVEHWRLLKGVPYPSNPENVKAIEDALSRHESARKDVWWYGQQRWDEKRIGAIIELAGAWGRRHGVRVWCGEFGVHKPVAPPADRARWLQQVHTLLEAQQIGWCLWDFDTNFGLMKREGGRRTLDESAAAALGLNLPQP